jgi:K+-sensing histidine kinase KdpD
VGSLRRQFADQSPGGRAGQDLDVIDTAVRRASELTTWVLSMPSGPEHAVTRTRSIDLAELVSEITWDLRPIVARHDIHITGPSQVVLDGDQTLVRAIVTNLILNAARRAVDGSAIDIEVRGRESWAEVTVSTPEWEPTQEELDDLFRPFSALNAALDGNSVDLLAATDLGATQTGVVVRAERDGGGSALTLRLPLQGLPGSRGNRQ